MRITGIKTHNYTFMVDGNGGEEQLVLVASSGQNGQTSFAWITTRVDLGPTHAFTQTNVATDEFIAHATQIICNWLEDQTPQVINRVQRALLKWTNC